MEKYFCIQGVAKLRSPLYVPAQYAAPNDWTWWNSYKRCDIIGMRNLFIKGESPMHIPSIIRLSIPSLPLQYELDTEDGAEAAKI